VEDFLLRVDGAETSPVTTSPYPSLRLGIVDGSVRSALVDPPIVET